MADPLTILVVDDDPDLREALGELLQERGYSARLLENGRAALDLLGSGVRPRLILLDLMMPEMNGWQFLEARQASEELRRIPVVVMTASRGLDVPPVPVLYKPVDLDRIVEAVELNALPA